MHANLAFDDAGDFPDLQRKCRAGDRLIQLPLASDEAEIAPLSSTGAMRVRLRRCGEGDLARADLRPQPFEFFPSGPSFLRRDQSSDTQNDLADADGGLVEEVLVFFVVLPQR